MIKAAFFDIDGTLVPFGRREISDANCDALDALKARGIKVFVCSGRPKYMINNLRDYPFDGYVCCNGGRVTVGDEVLLSRPMDPADAETVVRISRENGIGCVAFSAGEMRLNFHCEVERAISASLHVNLPVGDLETFIRQTIYQFTLYATREQEETLYAPLTGKVIFPRWHPRFMDVNPVGTSKAEGIAVAAERFGWGMDELMGFGDGGNDIPMLRSVGCSVAMGNATEEVKAEARYVTSAAEEDGITAALRHFGLI